MSEQLSPNPNEGTQDNAGAASSEEQPQTSFAEKDRRVREYKASTQYPGRARGCFPLMIGATALVGMIGYATLFDHDSDQAAQSPSQGTEAPAVPGEQTQLSERERQELKDAEKLERNLLDKECKSAAFGILDRIDNGYALSEGYNQNRFGNTHLPPEKKRPGVPEMLASFDTTTNLVTITSTATQIEDGNTEPVSEKFVFEIGPNNDIQKLTKQLDPNEFQRALSDHDTRVRALSINDGSGEYGVYVGADGLRVVTGKDANLMVAQASAGIIPLNESVSEKADTQDKLRDMRWRVRYAERKASIHMAEDTASGGSN